MRRIWGIWGRLFVGVLILTMSRGITFITVEWWLLATERIVSVMMMLSLRLLLFLLRWMLFRLLWIKLVIWKLVVFNILEISALQMMLISIIFKSRVITIMLLWIIYFSSVVLPLIMTTIMTVFNFRIRSRIFITVLNLIGNTSIIFTCIILGFTITILIIFIIILTVSFELCLLRQLWLDSCSSERWRRNQWIWNIKRIN